MKTDRRLAYAIKWFDAHETAILDRYFQFCSYQDYEDLRQDVLIYIHTHRSHIRLGRRGWKTYIRMTIMSRLRNRVRDSIARVKRERLSQRDMDTIVDASLDVATTMDVGAVVGAFASSTRHYVSGLNCRQVATKTQGKRYTVNTHYQRVYNKIKHDIRAVREAVYA